MQTGFTDLCVHVVAVDLHSFYHSFAHHLEDGFRVQVPESLVPGAECCSGASRHCRCVSTNLIAFLGEVSNFGNVCPCDSYSLCFHDIQIPLVGPFTGDLIILENSAEMILKPDFNA